MKVLVVFRLNDGGERYYRELSAYGRVGVELQLNKIKEEYPSSEITYLSEVEGVLPL